MPDLGDGINAAIMLHCLSMRSLGYTVLALIRSYRQERRFSYTFLAEVPPRSEPNTGQPTLTEYVEDLLFGGPEFRRGVKGTRKGEDVFYALGQTETGRHLFVVFLRKRGRKALVLTAREMTDRERAGYRRRKRHG